MKKLRPRLTYANVISTICLFLLLGGGAAFAASGLGKNTVGTKQLKNSAVTGSKIKNGAITGAKVQLSSLGTVPSATHAASSDSATNADQLGSLPASSYQGKIMWALVDAEDDSIVAQSGGISILAHDYPGGFQLHFPGRVAGSAIMVSPSLSLKTPFAKPVTGKASPCGTTSEGPTCTASGAGVNDADVEMQVEGKEKNAPFYITVTP